MLFPTLTCQRPQEFTKLTFTPPNVWGFVLCWILFFTLTLTHCNYFLGQRSGRTKVPRIFRNFVPNFLPNFAPNFPRIFRGVFVLRFLGNGDQKKFTKNPRPFSMQNSQPTTEKLFTRIFWRAGKVTKRYKGTRTHTQRQRFTYTDKARGGDRELESEKGDRSSGWQLMSKTSSRSLKAPLKCPFLWPF